MPCSLLRTQKNWPSRINIYTYIFHKERSGASERSFFYTRLKGKMQPSEDKKTFFILRPAFITAVLSVLLLINIVSLFTMDKQVKPGTTTVSEPAGIESFTKAYDMNSGSVYE